MPDNSRGEAIPFRAARTKRFAEITLHYAPVPKLGEGADYLKALNELPKGWTLAAWEHVEPGRDKPPANGEELVAALDGLIAEAESFRSELLCLSEIDAEDVQHYLCDRLRAVDDAVDALPERKGSSIEG